VSELAATGYPSRSHSCVALRARVVRLARQPYFRWLAKPIIESELTEANRANALFDAHRGGPEHRHRFLADEAGDAGQVMARRTARRICLTNGWFSVFSKNKQARAEKPGPSVHDDLVGRDFTASALNDLWLADINEHRTLEGRRYVCAIKDDFSNGIVG
jgi:hypothetical protein